jgi:hypothetical protein
MIQVYKIDSDGYFIEPVLVDKLSNMDSDCVSTPPPQGLVKLRYTNGKWIEGETTANILAATKAMKKARLAESFDASLMNGFTSTADGTSRTYAIDPVSMGKWTGALAVINSGKAIQNMTVKDFNGNKITLTSAQFQQMTADGFTFFYAQESHLWSLEDEVDSDITDTVDKVNAITW